MAHVAYGPEADMSTFQQLGSLSPSAPSQRYASFRNSTGTLFENEMPKPTQVGLGYLEF
jgi:hypothetical protein